MGEKQKYKIVVHDEEPDSFGWLIRGYLPENRFDTIEEWERASRTGRNGIKDFKANLQLKTPVKRGRPRNPTAEIKRILELRKQRKTWKQIAEKMNAETGNHRSAVTYRVMVRGKLTK